MGEKNAGGAVNVDVEGDDAVPPPGIYAPLQVTVQSDIEGFVSTTPLAFPTQTVVFQRAQAESPCCLPESVPMPDRLLVVPVITIKPTAKITTVAAMRAIAGVMPFLII